MHAGTVGGDVVNYLASWRSNEKRLLFSNRRGNPYSGKQGRAASALADSGRFRYSSLWDARLPALARELACFKWRIAKGHTGSVAACRCEYENAGLRSRPRIRTARRGGESGPFVDRCGQVRKEVSKCMVGAVGVEPTTNGLKDPQTGQQLHINTVTYNRTSSDWARALSHLGPIRCECPHKSRTPESVRCPNNSASA